MPNNSNNLDDINKRIDSLKRRRDGTLKQMDAQTKQMNKVASNYNGNFWEKRYSPFLVPAQELDMKFNEAGVKNKINTVNKLNSQLSDLYDQRRKILDAEAPKQDNNDKEGSSKNNPKRTTTAKISAPKADTTQFGVAPEGWTQEDWNNSMAMYKADSEHYYDTQRNKPVGNTGKTQDQVFGELYNQYTTSPTSFNQAQAEQLLKLSEKLGYAYGYKTGNPEAQKQREAGYTSNGIQSPTTNNTAPIQQTQTTVQRTVSESPSVSINDQARMGFKTNDTTGYYSGQNPGIRNLYL